MTDVGFSERARILLVDGQSKIDFYRTLVAAVDADWRSISPPELWRDQDADLVIVNDETWPHCAAALPELHRRGVPTLHVIDGILEWRNVWENPRSLTEQNGLPLFQPVLSDKIACLGHAQARVLESWGNDGKCEVTGSPRLDPLIGREPRVRMPGEPWRALVVTARTPGFTPEQRARIRESLLDLKRWVASNPVHDGVPVSLVWRLTGELDREIDVDNEPGNPSLADQLRSVDAMITSPSTALLEGMLCGVPVALIDYLNRPPYTPAAWTVTAPAQVDDTMRALMDPEPPRMLYQNAVLHDNLECETPAAARVGNVMRCMVEVGRRCRASGQPLRLPARILPRGEPVGGSAPDYATIHPSHPIFADRDVAALQAEVAHLRSVMNTRPSQMAYRLLAKLQRQALQLLNRVRGGRGH